MLSYDSDINALAQEYGRLLSRQSQRDLPKTTFARGIRKGKLMAKEYPGILLCIASVLRSAKGNQMLNRRETFRTNGNAGLQDWLTLVETLLQWEMWLKSDYMKREHVIKARRKHLYIMYLIKEVGNRLQGMGLKVVKFHAIMHIPKLHGVTQNMLLRRAWPCTYSL